MKVAVFDLDGTVIDGDSFVGFLFALLKQYPTQFARCFHLPLAVCAYYTGLRSNGWLKDVFLRAIAGGLSRAQIDLVVMEYVNHLIGSKLKRGAIGAMETHQKDGVRVVLASASPDLYLHALAERLGIDYVVGTRVEWRDDTCTGRLLGQNCYGADKLAAILQQFDQLDYAYSDHHSDLPLLMHAKQGTAVDPTPKLRRLASNHGIPVATWTG